MEENVPGYEVKTTERSGARQERERTRWRTRWKEGTRWQGWTSCKYLDNLELKLHKSWLQIEMVLLMGL